MSTTHITKHHTTKPFHLAAFSEHASKNADQCWQSARLHLSAVENLLRQYSAAPGLIGRAAAYQINSGGKRWRPLFLLAVGGSLNGDVEAMIKLAAATELLHNASLVHDDLQDRDTMRRGRETIWRRFGAETAINLGDFLISSTYLALSQIKAPGEEVSRLVGHFAQATHLVIAGQSMEIDASRRFDIGVEDYRRIAKNKSGVLMALPVVGAMLLTRASADVTGNARQAMEWLGTAYQIRDELDDLFGRKAGRAAGVDLREGRISLPNMLFHQTADSPERQAFEAFIASSEPPAASELDYWVARLRQSSAVSRCWAEFDAALDKAARHINALPQLLASVLEKGRQMLMQTNPTEAPGTQNLAASAHDRHEPAANAGGAAARTRGPVVADGDDARH